LRRTPSIAPTFALAFLSASFAFTQTTQPSAKITGDVVPAADWQQVAPESVGYSSAKLEALRAWVKTQDTGSMMVVVQGRVIFSYGDVAHASKIASARKSVLDMLYGKYVMNNTIDVGKNVKELGLEDPKAPFYPMEAKATLIQLLAARSCIYLPERVHPGDLSDGDQGRFMPPRNSCFPGAQMVYNNWDFDNAGVVFEKLVGKSVYEALRDDLAAPLGMQDYDVERQKKEKAASVSKEGYPLWLSTRDMARLGLLMLEGGKWNTKDLIPNDWVRYSTTLLTPFHDVHPIQMRNDGEPARWGYGTMWWVWDAPMFPGDTWTGFMQGAYTAMGTGGTFITVLPGKDMVVVHQVDIDKNSHASVSQTSYMAMLSMIADANCGDNCK
jgi:CubicO group peptidase (beta-lactamase class C family)